MANPTIESLAAELAAGRTTSRKLTEEAFARIEDPRGEGKRVFIKLYKPQAMATAEASAHPSAAMTPTTAVQPTVTSVPSITPNAPAPPSKLRPEPRPRSPVPAKTVEPVEPQAPPPVPQSPPPKPEAID